MVTCIKAPAPPTLILGLCAAITKLRTTVALCTELDVLRKCGCGSTSRIELHIFGVVTSGYMPTVLFHLRRCMDIVPLLRVCTWFFFFTSCFADF